MSHVACMQIREMRNPWAHQTYGSHSLVVGATHSSLYKKYLTREGSIAPVEASHVIHSAGKITKLDMETRRGLATGEGTPT